MGVRNSKAAWEAQGWRREVGSDPTKFLMNIVLSEVRDPRVSAWRRRVSDKVRFLPPDADANAVAAVLCVLLTIPACGQPA